MSLWSRISDALAALANGESLAEVFERLRTPPEQSVGFAIAVIGLGAKMAKADGRVTRDEVTVFRQIFTIPEAEEANAARVFNLARQDAAGFETYAHKIAAMFGQGHDVLDDLVESLFHIAVADGEYHRNENQFIRQVAEIFGITERRFRAIRARFVPDAPRDPYEVLGVEPDVPLDEIRRAWRKLVRDNHPDQMIARGLPEEAIQLATSRLARINEAWEAIEAQHER